MRTAAAEPSKPYPRLDQGFRLGPSVSRAVPTLRRHCRAGSREKRYPQQDSSRRGDYYYYTNEGKKFQIWSGPTCSALASPMRSHQRTARPVPTAV
ncbi:hypothetical protein VTK73DRAFT_1995 [Phialemonium thermophilum]|uniref:Uncharacterized protein n=1 Tax=Phialemonium thermophilum TaxID=223376 RepID=A0ABR3VSQ1_9PEZI